MNAETGNRVASMQMVKGTASGSRHELRRAIRLHRDHTILVKFQGCVFARKESCQKNVFPPFSLIKFLYCTSFLKRTMCVCSLGLSVKGVPFLVRSGPDPTVDLLHPPTCHHLSSVLKLQLLHHSRPDYCSSLCAVYRALREIPWI